MKFPILSNLLALCAMIAQVTPTIAMEQSVLKESEKYDDAALEESRRKVNFLIGEASRFLKLRTENIVVTPETISTIGALIHDVERIENQFTFSNNRIPDRMPNNLNELKNALQEALDKNFWNGDTKFSTVNPLKHRLEGALLLVFGSDVRTAIYDQTQQAPLVPATLSIETQEEGHIFQSISSQPDEPLNEVQEFSVMSKALSVSCSLNDLSMLGSEEQILASRKFLQANGQLIQLKKRAEDLLRKLPKNSVNRRAPLKKMVKELSTMLGSDDSIKTLLLKIPDYQKITEIVAENSGDMADSCVFFSPSNNNDSSAQISIDPGLQASVYIGQAVVTTGSQSLEMSADPQPLLITPLGKITQICEIIKGSGSSEKIKTLRLQALYFETWIEARKEKTDVIVIDKKQKNVSNYSNLLPIFEALRDLRATPLPVREVGNRKVVKRIVPIIPLINNNVLLEEAINYFSNYTAHLAEDIRGVFLTDLRKKKYMADMDARSVDVTLLKQASPDFLKDWLPTAENSLESLKTFVSENGDKKWMRNKVHLYEQQLQEGRDRYNQQRAEALIAEQNAQKKQQDERFIAVKKFVDNAYSISLPASHYKSQPEVLKKTIGDLITYAQEVNLIKSNGSHSLHPILEELKSFPENDELKGNLLELTKYLTQLDELDQKFDNQRKGVDAVFFALTVASAVHHQKLKKDVEIITRFINCRPLDKINFDSPMYEAGSLALSFATLFPFGKSKPIDYVTSPLKPIQQHISATLSSLPEDDKRRKDGTTAQWFETLRVLERLDNARIAAVEQNELQKEKSKKINAVGAFIHPMLSPDFIKNAYSANIIQYYGVKAREENMIDDAPLSSLKPIWRYITDTMAFLPEDDPRKDNKTGWPVQLRTLSAIDREQREFDRRKEIFTDKSRSNSIIVRTMDYNLSRLQSKSVSTDIAINYVRKHAHMLERPKPIFAEPEKDDALFYKVRDDWDYFKKPIYKKMLTGRYWGLS